MADRHGLDAAFNGQIFRKDNPMVLACRRELALILPVRLDFDAGGYPAGQVLARNTTSGFYQKYVNGGASGLGTAACILFFDVSAEGSSGTALERGIFGGEVFQTALTGLDSGAITNLGARSIIQADGTQILIF